MAESSPERIALFTIESFAAGEAVARFVERHQERIVLIVTTDTLGEGLMATACRLRLIFRRSGLRFFPFLFCNFHLYVALVHFGERLAALRRRPQTVSPIRSRCRRHGIAHLKTAAVNAGVVEDALIRSGVNLIVVCYFDQILQGNIIRIPSGGVLNLHTALLPEYRGLFPEIHMAAAGEQRFGSTVHLIVDESIDAGPIVAREEAQPPPLRDVLELSRNLHLQGVDLLSRTIDELDDVRLRATPQTAGSYFSFPSRAELRALDLRGVRLWSVRAIWRRTVAPVSEPDCP